MDQSVHVFKVQDHSRGINEDVFINGSGNDIVFNPQTAGQSFLTDAFSAIIPLTGEQAAKEHSFTMRFFLHGSEQLVFDPIAIENKI